MLYYFMLACWQNFAALYKFREFCQIFLHSPYYAAKTNNLANENILNIVQDYVKPTKKAFSAMTILNSFTICKYAPTTTLYICIYAIYVIVFLHWLCFITSFGTLQNFKMNGIDFHQSLIPYLKTLERFVYPPCDSDPHILPPSYMKSV